MLVSLLCTCWQGNHQGQRPRSAPGFLRHAVPTWLLTSTSSFLVSLLFSEKNSSYLSLGRGFEHLLPGVSRKACKIPKDCLDRVRLPEIVRERWSKVRRTLNLRNKSQKRKQCHECSHCSSISLNIYWALRPSLDSYTLIDCSLSGNGKKQAVHFTVTTRYGKSTSSAFHVPECVWLH